MKRKKARTLFFWGTTREGLDRVDRDDSDTETEDNEVVEGNPQLNLILKKGARFKKHGVNLPFEMLMKIFTYVIELSNHPLRDLCCLARVCDEWRQIVVDSPTLWSRIDMSQLPMTDSNFFVLARIFRHNPSILQHVNEFSFGGLLSCKNATTFTFIDQLMAAPNLTTLKISEIRPQTRTTIPGSIPHAVARCRRLKSLTITHSRIIFQSQKWLADALIENGIDLEELNLAMSMTSISSQLFRSIGADFCPKLKILDLSTCDTLSTHSFDAVAFSKSMPSLEVLRLGNVSFKRVDSPPEVFGLTKLRELSMPIGMRDADRDDALFATLSFGSDKIVALDLRGSSISAQALLDMPSYGVRELHMDDLCPITRRDYHRVIKKWSNTLEVLSLVKINCSSTVKNCLNALSDGGSHISELDLSASDILAEDLREFIVSAKALTSINSSSCRSLPRGCKGLFTKKPSDSRTQKISELAKKLR